MIKRILGYFTWNMRLQWLSLTIVLMEVLRKLEATGPHVDTINTCRRDIVAVDVALVCLNDSVSAAKAFIVDLEEGRTAIVLSTSRLHVHAPITTSNRRWHQDRCSGANLARTSIYLILESKEGKYSCFQIS